MKKILYILLLICISIIGVLLYAYKIEPNTIKINSISLNEKTDKKITIVQISDIELSKNYTTKQFEKVAYKINELNPDIVFFTGDLFNNYSQYKPYDETIAVLSSINASIGKYAIYGNNDHGGGASKIYDELMTLSGFKVLINNSDVIELNNGECIYIGGIDDELLGTTNIEETFSNWNNTIDYTILLAHEPYLISNFLDYPINLVLSGHTHGGQIDFPFVDRSYLLSEVENKYLNGLFTFDNKYKTLLYVNQGLGTSRLPLRFLVPPEITVFTYYLK